jgi:anti-sigma B factor antagonist
MGTSGDRELLDLDILELEGALVVQLKVARLDAAAASQLRLRIAECLGNQMLLVVDLAQVAFVDSAGLGALVSVMQSMPPGGRMCLSGVSESVQSLLRITRLNRIFAVHPTVEEALRA